MQSTAKKTADDLRDFVVVPSDQVEVAPSDAEITDLLRAAARRSDTVSSPPPSSASVPAVDATFRATAVNENVVRRSSFGRQLLRVIVALVLAIGFGVGWQVFGYAAKETAGEWLPKLAFITSLPLDKLGLTAPPQSAEPITPEEAPEQAASAAPGVSDVATATATASAVDSTQQSLQSMARDLASANQEIETLKASIAELKASQQQMVRERAAEQAAKAKLAATPPRPPAAHKPVPAYAPTPTPGAPSGAQAARSASPYASTQTVGSPPQAVAQPYAPRQAEPAPVPLQPQAEPGLASIPRPPMPITQ